VAGAAAGPSGGGQHQQLDFLRQQREQRELAELAAEVDAKLRAVRLAEQPAGPLAPEVLRQLLHECRRRQDVVEAALLVGCLEVGGASSRAPVAWSALLTACTQVAWTPALTGGALLAGATTGAEPGSCRRQEGQQQVGQRWRREQPEGQQQRGLLE
jgi:hypothetical protein